ncbi:MAG: diguanylate cyclase [Rhodospirillales bacterium]|nr:diguanylate cyclase [Rhodospirillales bacterium]
MNSIAEDRRAAGLRFSWETIQAFLEFFDDLACLCQDGIILRINDHGLDLLRAKDRSQVIGRPFTDFMPAEYQDDDTLNMFLEEEGVCPAKIRRVDGTTFGVDFRVQWARELGDEYLVVRATDISERIHMAEDIQRSEARFRKLVGNTMQMIAAVEDGKITFINHAGVELIGAKGAEYVVGEPVASIFHSDYAELFGDMIAEMAQEEDMIPARLARRDGGFIDVHTGLTALGDTGHAFMIEVHDITAHRKAVMSLHKLNMELEQRVSDRTRELSEEVDRRRKAEEQMSYLARHDALTGLPNRSLMMGLLDNEIRHATRDQTTLALMFIDLDGFKAINDTMGHDAGDELLKQVSERLDDSVRVSDTVARFGGDEFVICCPKAGTETDIAGIARKILATLEAPFDLDGREGKIGASIGIAVFPQHGRDVDALLLAADDCMYAVKAAGKNAYTFSGRPPLPKNTH